MSDNTQKRYIKVYLSEDDCDCLCEMAAEYDTDVNTFVSKICRDIAELGVKGDDAAWPLKHLDKYLETRHHESDFGFLVSLFAEDRFHDAIMELNRLRSPMSAADDDGEAEAAFFKRLYEAYLDDDGDAEDSFEVAREKLDKAYKGRMGLSDADPFRAYLSAIYLAADNNGKEDHKELIKSIQEAYQKIRDEL